jgi:hypothetical protein
MSSAVIFVVLILGPPSLAKVGVGVRSDDLSGASAGLGAGVGWLLHRRLSRLIA